MRTIGGVKSVGITDSPDGTGTINIDISQIAQEGNTWPTPERLKDALASGQEGPTGTDVPYSFRALNMDAADVQSIEDAGFALQELTVTFNMQDGTTVQLSKHIVDAMHAPVAERGKYGVVIVSGKATGIVFADVMTVTAAA